MELFFLALEFSLQHSLCMFCTRPSRLFDARANKNVPAVCEGSATEQLERMALATDFTKEPTIDLRNDLRLRAAWAD